MACYYTLCNKFLIQKKNIIQVTKYEGGMTFVTVTHSYNTGKNIEDSEIDDIIQYSNNILVL